MRTPAVSIPLDGTLQARGARRPAVAVAVTFADVDGRVGACFDGRTSSIQIPDCPAIALGRRDFTISLWLHSDGTRDLVGGLLQKFDPVPRTGFQLSVVTQAGVVSNQSNFRQLHVGMDNGTDARWTDCGRPGQAHKVAALANWRNRLYAGTLEAGDAPGRVYCREAGRWTDCGAPDASNCVCSLAEYRGELYCATGHYKTRGSAMRDGFSNRAAGGRIFRYAGDQHWAPCGRLKGMHVDGVVPGGFEDPGPVVRAASFLTVFEDQLYAGALYNRGIWRYEGGRRWQFFPMECRIFAMIPYRGELLLLSNGNTIYRFSPTGIEPIATLPETSQIYAGAIHAGQLFAGTWPNALVYRSTDARSWVSTGRVGCNMEVMGMNTYNGKLYAGVLPMADVHRYDGDQGWTWTGNVDRSPAELKRAWTMALHGDSLYAGTLPGGRVARYRAGTALTHGQVLPGGWHRIAVSRKGGVLRLYLDGEHLAQSGTRSAEALDLTTDQPLQLGIGQQEHLHGMLADVRIYDAALTAEELRQECR